MQIRRIELKTADGLSPLPMSSAWVRDGLFLIGMDSEFAVYSQWRGREETALSNADTRTSSGKDFVDHRHLPEADLLNMAQVRFRSYQSAVKKVFGLVVSFTNIFRKAFSPNHIHMHIELVF